MKLISTIAKIVITGSAAHERQRSEVIQTVKTLDQLTAAPRNKGCDPQFTYNLFLEMSFHSKQKDM